MDPSLEEAQVPQGTRILCDLDYHREVTRGDARAVLRGTADALVMRGFDVERDRLPQAFDEIQQVWDCIGPFEANATIGPIVAGAPGRPLLHERLARGAATSRDAYRGAFRTRTLIQAAIERLLESFDAFMLLTAGPVPTREQTGNQQNHLVRSWTMLGNPSITIPGGLDDDGMPVGIQLVGRRGGDAHSSLSPRVSSPS